MRSIIVSVIMGSDSDLPIMKEALDVLNDFGVGNEVLVLSAHRTFEATREYAMSAVRKGTKVVIAGAGGSAHLPGVIAAISPLPVIGVPIKSKSLDGLDSLLSIVQMPPGIPVATVGINSAKNAALLAIEILATSDKRLLQKLTEYRTKQKKSVLVKTEKLKTLGYQKYLEALKNNMIQEKVILKSLPKVLKTIDLPLGKKLQGKVRDIYLKDKKRILITTDRQSAFDVVLGHIPFKGAVLNQLSAFWFKKTKHIVENHLLEIPDPNVSVTKNCQPIPVEMIVRGYISGVTKTSIWYSYERGERLIYGLKFPDGLRKNQKLTKPVLTPTTHPLVGATGHDERLTREQIISKKIVSKKLYEQMEKTALALFKYGTKLCLSKGLILVDTKYEFGIHYGKLTLIDEIHTPDSSRFWIAKTYKARFEKGLEPDNFDKEFLRLWYVKRGYRGDGPPPAMTEELIVAVAQRYIGVYEKLTGKKFHAFDYPIEKRIKKNLSSYL